MHSFFSSAITKTDWYIESLEELIVDILHSGLSLWRENTSRHFLSLGDDPNTHKRSAGSQKCSLNPSSRTYLYILVKCFFSSIVFSQLSSLSKKDSSSLYPVEVL